MAKKDLLTAAYITTTTEALDVYAHRAQLVPSYNLCVSLTILEELHDHPSRDFLVKHFRVFFARGHAGAARGDNRFSEHERAISRRVPIRMTAHDRINLPRESQC